MRVRKIEANPGASAKFFWNRHGLGLGFEHNRLFTTVTTSGYDVIAKDQESNDAYRLLYRVFPA